MDRGWRTLRGMSYIPSAYKNQRIPHGGHLCAICQLRTRSEEPAELLQMTHGVSVWLCPKHGSDEFLTGDNMANLARQVAVFGIIAVGQLLVILTAGIDLSVGSVLGLTGCITAELLVHGVGIVPAILRPG